ncbi:MAG TPA: hypothetical protein VID50_09250 [Candidatus Eisenbacteria bacterium]
MRPGLRRAALALALFAGTVPGTGASQALRISSLRVPEDAVLGSWVSYRVVTQTRKTPPREMLQRAATVAEEGIGKDAGLWVELKTVDPQAGTRIDRAFFSRGAGAELPGREPDAPRSLRLVRLQRLHPDGKLYEYKPNSDVLLRAEEDVTSLGLFEIGDSSAARIDTLGADTLRIGRRLLPATIVRKRWVADDEWPDEEDSTSVLRPGITVTTYECPDVPLTGYTRAVFEVRSMRFAVGDSLRAQPVPPADPAGDTSLVRVELTLEDLGTGAVPEVIQEPEPAPDEDDSGRPTVPSR